MQWILDLGEDYKGKKVEVLEVVRLMLYKQNKAEQQIQRVSIITDNNLKIVMLINVNTLAQDMVDVLIH